MTLLKSLAGSPRFIPVIAGIVSAVLLWQAWRLDRWGMFGPGAGLFPQLIAVFCFACAAMLALFPVLGRDPTPGGSPQDDDGPLQPAERRAYVSYIAGLAVTAVAATFFGFVALCVGLALVTTWLGERKSLVKALAFGVLCGLVGVVGFGYYMSVEVPATRLEYSIVRLLR